ncbi:MAG: hypothetical protein KC910_17010, partial [Candidatus Eremiobacteraeota bacterium]|nr:hypothetical protein [Candidatus Eremiobacteraeota bacterium]
MQICSCCESRPTPRRPATNPPHHASTCEQAQPQETVELATNAETSRPALKTLARQGQESAYQALLGGFTNFSAASIPEIFKLAKEHHPESVTHVLYHGGCRDGRTAAWAAYKALGDKAEYIPMGYQAPPPDLPPDARVAVVDFSFLPDVLDDLKKRVADVVILHHHDTAAERLQGVPGVVVDQERAGAGLSWHYFHPNEPLPALAAYAEDRDLWRFDLPLSKEVGTAMGVAEWDGPRSWDKLDIETLKRDGVEMTAFMDEQ